MALTIGSGPVWNGASSSSWKTSANWSGVAIQTDDSLTFDGNNRLTSTNNQSTVTEFRSIIFRSTAGSLGTGFTLGGTIGITLIGDFDGNLIRNDSPVAQTINLPITVKNAGTPINTTNAAGTTILGGQVNNGGNTLLFSGPGSATISSGGTLTGGGGLTMSGGGTLAINAATSYTGNTRIAAGTLNVGHAQALQTASWT